MDTRAAIKLGIDLAEQIVMGYIGDLTDEELMRRPHPTCNHINWQVGHLIVSENHMNSQALPGSMPALPDGFAEKYTRDTASSDNLRDFADKAELLRVYREQRTATLAALERTTDADFDKPTGISYAPTVGAVFMMAGGHWLMHAGQWVIVRRQLGKPHLF